MEIKNEIETLIFSELYTDCSKDLTKEKTMTMMLDNAYKELC